MSDTVTMTSTTEPESEIRAALSGEQAPVAVETPTPEPTLAEKSERAQKREIGKWAVRLEQATDTIARQERLIEQLTGALGGRREAVEAPQPSKRPELKDYATAEAWGEDLVRWGAKEEITRQFAERESAEENESREYERAELKNNFHASAAEYARTHPDYIETLEDADPNDQSNVVPFEAELAIYEAENGPAVHQFLLSHPEEREKLRNMRQSQIGPYIGRLDAGFQGQRPVNGNGARQRTETSAPPPITPVRGGTGPVTVPIDNMSMRDYRNARRNGTIGRPRASRY